MKALRLLATFLLLGACIGFYSCKKDYVMDMPPTTNTPGDSFTEIDKKFAEYIKDYSNIKYRRALSNENVVILTGLKNKHLWFSEFDSSTKKLKLTWEDIEETDTIQQVHKGYGEYSEITISSIILMYYKETKAGNIVAFGLNDFPQTIFTSNGKSKRTKLESSYSNTNIHDWYNESIFVNGGCYSSEGDLIYTLKDFPYHFSVKDVEPLSYEEGIKFNTDHSLYFQRLNLKEDKSVWTTYLKDIQYSSNSKVNYAILDKSTNIWKYKLDITSFDGTTHGYILKLNIEDGKLNTSEEGVKVTGVTLNKAQLTLEIGETFQLIATVQPDKAENKEIIWSSSDESIATVDKNGLVTAKSDGEATISVTTQDGGFTATSTITIKEKEINDYITTTINNSLINIGGYVEGVIGIKIINNSKETIQLKSLTILDDKGTALKTIPYTNISVEGGSNYQEEVKIKSILQELTMTWVYTHNNKDYNYTIKVPIQ